MYINIYCFSSSVVRVLSKKKKKKRYLVRRMKKFQNVLYDFDNVTICNHGPPAPGNSEEFDFWSSKSPLKTPPCGDCSLVKPLLFSLTAYYLFMSWSFLPIQASPALPWQNFVQIPANFHSYPQPSTRGGLDRGYK